MCTGVRLSAKTGTVYYGRTLEFGKELNSQAIGIPRKQAFAGSAPDGKQGLAWQSLYATIGMNALGKQILVDGVNEAGLAGGIFYFQNHAQYQEVKPNEYAQTLAPWELLTFLLTTCASLTEVHEKLLTIKVASVALPEWGIVPPVHYVIHDATGNSLVIEYVSGHMLIYDNPLGVITNAPGFDWHVTNLNNSITLTPFNHPEYQLGQGSGLLGLPGDFTSPSRFIRAVVYTHSVTELETDAETYNTLFHILGLFSIPVGIVRQQEDNGFASDYTQWTSGIDLQKKEYHYYTYRDRTIKTVSIEQALNLKTLTVL